MAAAIDILVQELNTPNGRLSHLQQKLQISAYDVREEQLSREKKPAATFKLTGSKRGWNWFQNYSESWVVKFSPKEKDKQDEPWYDVHQEYDILAGFYNGNPTGPQSVSPAPIYRSTDGDRGVVGTKFIIMSFVEGKSFENAQAIPEDDRETAFSSVMTKLSQNVHSYHWVTDPQYAAVCKEHTQSHTFWKPLINTWKSNYDAAVKKASLRSQHCYNQFNPIQAIPTLNNTTDTFFQQMTSDNVVKRSHKETRVIHGDMNISNVIFDDQYNVKAIVDWKAPVNGDPMVDVAYLCLTFMTPEDYGEKFEPLNDHPLLLGYANDMESTILRVYQSCCNFSFNENRFNFAKAVCCLRWLSILQAARADNFVGHESGDYEDNTDSTQLVMDCLAAAGENFYIKSL